MGSKPNDWKLAHIGLVVKDMDKAVNQYQSLGMGPFTTPKGTPARKRTYMGQTVSPDKFGFAIRVGELGPVVVELVQPVKGETIQKKYLESSGEGINHIGYEVENINEARGEIEKLGYKLVQSSEFENGEICLFFARENDTGVVIELIQRAKPLK